MFTNRFYSPGALFTGACIAGGLALLASPRTSEQARSLVKSFAEGAGAEMAKRFSTAIDRGIEYAERGQRALRDAGDAMDSAIERGKGYLASGRSMVNNMAGEREVRSCSGFATTGALLAGLLVGGGIALLLTPKSGEQFRKQLKGYAGKMRPYADQAKSAVAMVRDK